MPLKFLLKYPELNDVYR